MISTVQVEPLLSPAALEEGFAGSPYGGFAGSPFRGRAGSPYSGRVASRPGVRLSPSSGIPSPTQSSATAPRELFGRLETFKGLRTGDPVMKGPRRKEPAPDTVLYARVSRDDKAPITLHKTRQQAFAEDDDVTHDEEYNPCVHVPISHAEVAKGRIRFVWATRSEARAYVDIDLSWQGVAFDALVALAGAIPGLGCLCVLYIVIKYVVANIHLDYQPSSPCGCQLLARALRATFRFCCLLAVGWGALGLLFTYKAKYDVFLEEEYTTAAEMSDAAQKVLSAVQFAAVRNLCTISIILHNILAVSSIQVYADVAFYKAEAEAKLSKRAAHTLKRLKQKFKDLYEAGEPPVCLNHPNLMEPLSWSSRLALAFSAMTMFAGLSAMWYSVWGESASWACWAPMILVMLITVAGWTRLLQMLLGSSMKIKKNTSQLVLFRALVLNHDFGRWRQRNRDLLHRILLHAQDDSEQHYSRRLPSDKDLKKEHESEDHHPELTELIGRLHKDALLCFDLRRMEDVIDWWSLREYTQVDFMDESAIMDYCSSITVSLLVAFLIMGLMDFASHADIREEIGDLLSSRHASEGGLRLIPLSSLIIIVSCIATLSAILFAIISECIAINELLDSDVVMLLSASRGAQLVLEPPKGSVGEARSKGSGETREVSPISVAMVLGTLIKSVKEVDSRQTLFGFPITSNLRNAIFASLGTALAQWAWTALGPVLQKVNLHDVSQLMGLIFNITAS